MMFSAFAPFLSLVLVCVASFIFAPYSFAQSTDTTRIDALLWQISGNGIAKPSYLFGTIHLICKSDVVMPQATKRCLASAKQLALEFDLSKADESAMLNALDAGILMRDGATLRQFLDSSQYALIDRYFRDSVGLSLQTMEHFKPMAISMMIMQASSDGECEETSYEEEFMRFAKRRRIPVVGVETMQKQLELFDRIPYKDQALMLFGEIQSAYAPLSADKPSALDLSYVTKLYKQGKISELLQAMRKETLLSAPNGMSNTTFEEIMLNERNRAWIPVMEGMMRSKITFFAVGAAHLAGEQGVVNLLRKRGFTLSPMK
ncbi:MAG: TraB/GumN family protein [Candidatus Kapaibacterium sp.]|nr:MAG: TraB/GumN family protein [Candidatus Kapabacteria bacterium]